MNRRVGTFCPRGGGTYFDPRLVRQDDISNMVLFSREVSLDVLRVARGRIQRPQNVRYRAILMLAYLNYYLDVNIDHLETELGVQLLNQDENNARGAWNSANVSDDESRLQFDPRLYSNDALRDMQFFSASAMTVLEEIAVGDGVEVPVRNAVVILIANTSRKLCTWADRLGIQLNPQNVREVMRVWEVAVGRI